MDHKKAKLGDLASEGLEDELRGVIEALGVEFGRSLATRMLAMVQAYESVAEKVSEELEEANTEDRTGLELALKLIEELRREVLDA